MGWICNSDVEKRSAYRILVGKPVQKRPVGRLKKLDDNIKMDLRKEVVWMELAHDRIEWRALVLAVFNLRVSFYVTENSL
jgi:hypothetical protein